mmetsp:Transcript_10768/g.31773  ORF Transcript_10768/g.31773 Transcript_10768/m.31773 type:complete len:250 (+) Transcript_10768:2697-3446(+)
MNAAGSLSEDETASSWSILTTDEMTPSKRAAASTRSSPSNENTPPASLASSNSSKGLEMDEGASLIAWRHATDALWASRNSNAFASFSANKRTSFCLGRFGASSKGKGGHASSNNADSSDRIAVAGCSDGGANNHLRRNRCEAARAPLDGSNLGTNAGTSSSSAKPTSLAVEANKGRCVLGVDTRTSSANDKGSSTHKTDRATSSANKRTRPSVVPGSSNRTARSSSSRSRSSTKARAFRFAAFLLLIS